MANVPIPLSYDQILANELSAYATKLGVNDFNVGAINLSFFEVCALVTARASGDLFQILRDYSITRATGDALKRLALENNVTPITSKPSSGLVNIIDSSFVKISTKIYAGANPPNIGSVQIKASDASKFTATGAVYIGRGTPNVEGPLPYTSISQSGGFYIINLTNPTTKFHNVGETIILAQGGNRAISTNTVPISPAVGTTTDIQFGVTTSGVILDGETEVDNIQVSALNPGASGNVPMGAIKSFASPPFAGATVMNPLAFTNGADSETDDQLRVRIQRALSSIGLGTATAITSAIIGATPSDENATIISASIVNTSEFSTVYIDNGTGYEAKTASVGLESIVDSALGGEQFFQLATGGRQAPVAKAFLIASNPEPYNILSGDALAIVVGNITYQHVFAATDFVSPGAATAYEVVASINGDTALGFEATTSGGGTFVVVRAIAESNDSLLATTPTTGNDASVALGFPANQIDTLRLYKNDVPLSKDGNQASILTQNQTLWSASISSGDTLVLSVDGTAPITYTILDSDFISTGLFNRVSATNSLASWVQVFNTKLTGITASIVNQQLEITSNLGASNRAQVTIDPSSTLVTKGMFGSLVGLSSIGSASDFTLDRNTAQFELVAPLIIGDKLAAGSTNTVAKIESAEIPGGSVTLVSDGHVWILADALGQVISTGVSGNSQLTVSAPSTNIIRYTSGNANAFSTVEVGYYVIVWSAELNAANQIEGRVHAVTSSTLDVLVTAAEYAAIVPQNNVTFLNGFVVLRSDLAPQKFRVTAGNKTLDQIAAELQFQTLDLTFSVLAEEFLNIVTNTRDSSGSLLIVTADTSGQLLSFPTSVTKTSENSLLAFYDSGNTQASMPLFIHSGFASEESANPIDSFVTSFDSDLNFSDRDPNELIAMLHPYGGIDDAQPYGENTQVTSLSGTTVGIADESLIRRLRASDRFFIANPLDFGSEDTAVVVLDNNPSDDSFEIPFYRDALTNTGYTTNSSNFNAYDSDSGATAQFSAAFGSSFDFSNFKVLMQAKKVLKHQAAQTALLFRAAKWGRSGEKITVGYSYPSIANSPISNTITIGETVDIRIFLKSGAPVSSSIDPTTQWNVTVTPNSPVAGVDQVTFTYSGVGTAPALTIAGGEYVNISSATLFSEANTGIFRVSTAAGFTPNTTSFSVEMPTGTGVVESNILTNVNSGIVFYQATPTMASDINTYINANLQLFITSTIVNDGGTTGSGVLTYSTYEDSDFAYDSVQLLDGINWLASSSLTGSPQFIFKKPLSLPTDVGYAFNNGETVRFIPTTMDQVDRFISVLAVTGFTTLGEVSLVDRSSSLELTTDTLGSAGSIQIVGGSGNSYSVPVTDSGLMVNNDLMEVTANNVASQAVHSDQWFRLQAETAQEKSTLFGSDSTISIIPNQPQSGQSTIQMGGRDLNERYFGKPRHFVRPVNNTFKIEKQGSLACLSWNGVGTTPSFSSTLNFNAASGGTLNCYPVSGTTNTRYDILSGSANFTQLSIGDYLTISGLSVPSNNGTFSVTGVSDDGTSVTVLNQASQNQFSSGSFTFSGNSTAGDIFTVGTTNLIAGVSFAVGGSSTVTATNLATAISAIPNITASAASGVVTLTSTAAIPSLTTNYTGSAVVTNKSNFTITSNPIAGDVFTVNSTNFVAGTDFTIGGTTTETATNLASAINAISGVTGSASSNIVTVTSTTTASLTLTFKGSGTVSVNSIFTFTANSTAGDIFTVGSTYFIAGSSFAVGVTTDITEANLSAAINSIPNISSSVSGSVVTVTATVPSATTALAYSGSNVVTVSGSTLTGVTFTSNTFSAISEVSEGDTLIISSPFSILNQGSFRVIRRFNDSVWYENANVINEEVTLTANAISLDYDVTTSFMVNSSENNLVLSWNGVGTQPHLENSQVGDLVTFNSDFASGNIGTFMVTSSGAALQQITQAVMPTGAQFTASGVGTYFLINSGGNLNQYYVWFNVNSSCSDPAPGGLTGIQVDIGSSDSSSVVATKLALQINGTSTLTGIATNNIVNMTTSLFQSSTPASNVNVPSPFSVNVIQAGRRTFLECLNPTASSQSTVFTATGIVCNRPQILFYEYEATVPNDQFVITGTLLTAANAGTYNIVQVVDQDTIIINGTLGAVSGVSLNQNTDTVFVQEGTPYFGYKQVYLISSQPGGAQNNVILFNTNAQFEKIDAAAGVALTSLNKLNFNTSIKNGLDSYNYNTGLIAEANRIIYGDPRDETTYPGVGAAGADIFVREPLTLRIQVAVVVRLNTGIAFPQIVNQVQSNISSLINSNPVGQSIAIGAIVATVESIPGVMAASISVPVFSTTNDIIKVSGSQKARIINPVTDISVSQQGT